MLWTDKFAVHRVASFIWQYDWTAKKDSAGDGGRIVNSRPSNATLSRGLTFCGYRFCTAYGRKIKNKATIAPF